MWLEPARFAGVVSGDPAGDGEPDWWLSSPMVERAWERRNEGLFQPVAEGKLKAPPDTRKPRESTRPIGVGEGAECGVRRLVAARKIE